MKGSRILSVILACVVALGLAGLTGCVGGKTDVGDGYEISNQRIGAEEGSSLSYIQCTVKNTCGREETFLVTFDLFDKNGTKIGTAFGNAEDVPDGQAADLNALIIPDDMDNFLEIGNMVDSWDLLGVGFMKAETAAAQAGAEEAMRQLEEEQRIKELLGRN